MSVEQLSIQLPSEVIGFFSFIVHRLTNALVTDKYEWNEFKKLK